MENVKILKKYIVKYHVFDVDETTHIVEAENCDRAIEKMCEIKGIKYDPLNQPTCMVRRTDD